MKTRRTLSGVLLALGLILGGVTVSLAFWARSAQPVMGQTPEGAEARAEALMEAVCAGDYSSASRMLYGTPSLGQVPADASPSAALIWEAFLDSLFYDFPGECYITDDAVAREVNIRFLDVSGALEGLDTRAEALLDRKVQTAKDSGQLYDEDNNFRQELIDEVLMIAVAQALAEDQTYREQTITLRMVLSEGKWWVMPDSELLDVLAGAVSG